MFDFNGFNVLPRGRWRYLCRHVLADSLDFHLDILDQQVELILDKLQPVNVILSVL